MKSFFGVIAGKGQSMFGFLGHRGSIGAVVRPSECYDCIDRIKASARAMHETMNDSY